MEGMSISDFLNKIKSGQNVRDKSTRHLENNLKTWLRIGSKDLFNELDFSTEEEKNDWLKQWMSENEYKNINK